MLIETSNSKIPRSHLGSSNNILDYKPSFDTNGHVARNIRLSLMAIDIVEPYVSIKSLNGVDLVDDVVPMTDRYGRSCQKTKIMSVPSTTSTSNGSNNMENNNATVTWTVSGAFTVDFTTIYYANWDDISTTIKCTGHPSKDEMGSEFRIVQAMKGITRWHSSGPETTFKATFDISDFKAGDKIAVFATARVDQGWTNQPTTPSPKVPPMSHIVNARSNTEWFHESAGKVIQGRKDWYSVPLTIVISQNKDDDQTVELSSRFIMPDDMVIYEGDDMVIYEGDESGFIRGNGIDDIYADEDDDDYSKLLIIIILSFVTTFTMYKVVKKYFLYEKKPYIRQSLSTDDDEMFDNDFTFEEDIQLRELS